jgi:hypothetical protein
VRRGGRRRWRGQAVAAGAVQPGDQAEH